MKRILLLILAACFPAIGLLAAEVEPMAGRYDYHPWRDKRIVGEG